jgi:hypothetical protein
MDLIDRAFELADEAAEAGGHELSQALHAIANLGGKAPAAVVNAAPGGQSHTPSAWKLAAPAESQNGAVGSEPTGLPPSRTVRHMLPPH